MAKLNLLHGRPERFVRSIPLIIALTGVWLIMNEGFSPLLVISGILVAIAALLGTRMVIHRSYVDELWIGWRAGLALFPAVFRLIFTSAFTMAKAILRGDTDTVAFRYQSVLEDDLSIFLLCTFIILTPGTMVVGRKDSLLTIIGIGKDVAAARAGCEEIEHRIEAVSAPMVGGRARSARIAAARRAKKLREETLAKAASGGEGAK
jgi:multisubunit Na+/H+ antiporter MnhE subunit